MHRRVLMKDIKQDLRKKKDIIVFLMRRISIIKCQFLKEKNLNAVLRPDPLSMWGMEVEDDKIFLKFIWKKKCPQQLIKEWLRRILKGLPLRDSKIHCNPVIIQKAIVISGLVFLCEEVSAAVKLTLFPVPSVLPFLGGGQITWLVSLGEGIVHTGLSPLLPPTPCHFSPGLSMATPWVNK